MENGIFTYSYHKNQRFMKVNIPFCMDPHVFFSNVRLKKLLRQLTDARRKRCTPGSSQVEVDLHRNPCGFFCSKCHCSKLRNKI